MKQTLKKVFSQICGGLYMCGVEVGPIKLGWLGKSDSDSNRLKSKDRPSEITSRVTQLAESIGREMSALGKSIASVLCGITDDAADPPLHEEQPYNANTTIIAKLDHPEGQTLKSQAVANKRTVYCETQKGYNCGIHAVNAAFGKEVLTSEDAVRALLIDNFFKPVDTGQINSRPVQAEDGEIQQANEEPKQSESDDGKPKSSFDNKKALEDQKNAIAAGKNSFGLANPKFFSLLVLENEPSKTIKISKSEFLNGKRGDEVCEISGRKLDDLWASLAGSQSNDNVQTQITVNMNADRFIELMGGLEATKLGDLSAPHVPNDDADSDKLKWKVESSFIPDDLEKPGEPPKNKFLLENTSQVFDRLLLRVEKQEEHDKITDLNMVFLECNKDKDSHFVTYKYFPEEGGQKKGGWLRIDSKKAHKVEERQAESQGSDPRGIPASGRYDHSEFDKPLDNGAMKKMLDKAKLNEQVAFFCYRGNVQRDPDSAESEFATQEIFDDPPPPKLARLRQ